MVYGSEVCIEGTICTVSEFPLGPFGHIKRSHGVRDNKVKSLPLGLNVEGS